jgi:hypothetical protein
MMGEHALCGPDQRQRGAAHAADIASLQAPCRMMAYARAMTPSNCEAHAHEDALQGMLRRLAMASAAASLWTQDATKSQPRPLARPSLRQSA